MCNCEFLVVDAWGKIPEGILSGHINFLGDFDECLAVRSPLQEANPFRGKYCLIYVIPKVDDQQGTLGSKWQQVQSGEHSVENLLVSSTYYSIVSVSRENIWGNVKHAIIPICRPLQKLLSIAGNAELPLIPSLGTCLPSSCADEEIFRIVGVLLTHLNLLPITSECSTDEATQMGSGAIATISFLGVLLMFVVFVGTLVDVVVIYDFMPTPKSSNTLFQVCKAFSLATNGRKFMNTESSPNDVSCLHGIRFLSASWVVLGHTYLMGIIQPLWNIVDTYSVSFHDDNNNESILFSV